MTDKKEKIEEHFRGIMEALGLDVNNPSLAKTPARVAKMYVDEVFSGLKEESFPKVSFIPVPEGEHNPPVVVVKSTFVSFCEHHFVPFSGTAFIAYKPNKKLIGLSKIPRILRYFAKRPQFQERLTSEVADTLGELLETKDIAVSITATHYCVVARGIEDHDSCMTTKTLRGAFENDLSLRQEFFEALHRN